RTGRWLKVVLGLAATTGLCAPTAATAVTPLDTARATGSGPPFDSVNITAQGTPIGQSVSGTAAVSAFGLNLSGPVTCLSVTGPDQGAGTPTSPTTAILNFQDPRGVLTVQLVDNGGNGADDITVFAGGRAPSDCSSPVPG